MGRAVEVAYDPLDPARAVLEPGEASRAWGTVVRYSVFLLLGAAFLLFAR